jgi:phosphoribosylformimino-5-aminoimidazole carboxamide ribotide isomerase
VRCIFVLDIFNGTVVHAVRGERDRYHSIERYSKIVSTSDPLRLLEEIRPKEVYLADLNRLTGIGENLEVIDRISRLARTMADIGIAKRSDLDCLPLDIVPVLGTETASLQLMEEAALQRKIAVSIDMKSRRVLARDPEMAEQSPFDLLRRLGGLPLESVVLLELDRVGTSAGLDREFLEGAVSVGDHSLILGGGIRGPEDLQALEEMGFSGALVATAVHNRRIPLEMVR